jgi:hypothetical protein
MAEINESMINSNNIKKDKYMTPNLQGRSKMINKLNAAAYGSNNS